MLITSNKPGRVVIMLHGRFAGKKALLVRNYEEGTRVRRYPHALVVGLKQTGRKVTRRMSEKKIKRKTRVNVFVKYVNQCHFVPTRYKVSDFDFKDLLREDLLEEARKDRKKAQELRSKIREVLQNKYRNLPEDKGLLDKSNHIRYFFKKFRF